MARKLTLKEIDHEIAKLKQQADEIREGEKAEVIARVKEAVAYYGITAADLGLGKAPKQGLSNANGKRAGKPKALAGRIKFKDDAGHTWSGFGPKPRWFTEALANGKTEADLRA